MLILNLIEYLNYLGKSDYYSSENIYKIFGLSDSENFRLEIKYKFGLEANHIINKNDLNTFNRIKKINKLVNNI